MYKEPDHNSLSWTACFNDNCSIHQPAKDGAGWYPKAPQKTLAATQRIQLEEPEPPMDFISKVTPECIKIKGISPDNAIERLESLPDFDDQSGYKYLLWVLCYNDFCLIYADYKIDNSIFP